MLGVTWTDPSARVTGTIEVRTRDSESGAWSDWLKLDGDGGVGESSASRGGTEPAWVGPSDGVEARATAGGEVVKLPRGLRLDMVDPGTGKVSGIEPAAFALPAESESPSPSGSESAATDDPNTPTEPSSSASTSSQPPSETPSATAPTTTPPAAPPPAAAPTETVPPAPPSTAPRPPITMRSGWGADETISPEGPTYLPDEKIKAVTVHHTAESNNYTCAQAPAMVRGVYAYHVKSMGWKDIGYHFLVDKCGTIYEGRKGGVDRPVVGAHAYGFNNETTGIAVLGTYTSAAPSQSALNSVARIAAWKLGQYGVDPTGDTVLTAGAAGTSATRPSWNKGAQLSFKTIHGHRDGYATECPGGLLYGQLSTIRNLAGGAVAGLAVKSVSGAGLTGSTYYTKAAVTVNWTATTPTSFISKHELLVDGKVVATTPGTATSAKATLTPGTHKVQVRSTHVSGKTTTSPAATIIAETTAPRFTTAPGLALNTGTVNSTAVPVTLSWKAADNAALKEVRLTAPLARTYGPAVTSAAHSAKPGVATNWSMTAYDQAGNTAAASVSGTPVILQENQAVKTGSWSTKSSSSYLGGKSYSSAAKNASLTWTFTGRSAAWVVSRASTSGQANIYVDGRLVKMVDLKSATTKYRDAIWTQKWATSGKHTVKIVIVGTAKRPTVTTDGLVYLK
ncbi:peptidoglycan recognition protein family protein [Streptomyces sp. NPDC004726]